MPDESPFTRSVRLRLATDSNASSAETQMPEASQIRARKSNEQKKCFMAVYSRWKPIYWNRDYANGTGSKSRAFARKGCQTIDSARTQMQKLERNAADDGSTNRE